MPWSIIKYDDIEFDDGVRLLCKNAKLTCPNFDRSWACPPVSPLMKDFLGEFHQFHLVWFVYDLDARCDKMRKLHPDWSDRKCRNPRHYNGTIRAGLESEVKKFTQKLGAVDDEFVLWSGTCRVCKNKKDGGCTKPSGEPCRYPKRRRYSMESSGINVDATVLKIGLKLEWPPVHKVYQVGLISRGNVHLRKGLSKYASL